MLKVRLTSAQDEGLRHWCRLHDRQLSWAVRRAVEFWLRSPGVQASAQVDGWKAEPEGFVFRTLPATSVVYLRSPHSAEGGHEVCQGGRRIWVLPDGRTSGQARSRLITGAVAACEGLSLDALAYVWGVLARLGTGVLVDRGSG